MISNFIERIVISKLDKFINRNKRLFQNIVGKSVYFTKDSIYFQKILIFLSDKVNLIEDPFLPDFQGYLLKLDLNPMIENYNLTFIEDNEYFGYINKTLISFELISDEISKKTRSNYDLKINFLFNKHDVNSLKNELIQLSEKHYENLNNYLKTKINDKNHVEQEIYESRFYELNYARPTENNGDIRLFSHSFPFVKLMNYKYRDEKTLFLNNDLKSEIDNLFTLNEIRRDKCNKIGVVNQMNVLFYGPPGTGKTSLIKLLSLKFSKKMFIIRPKDIYYLDMIIEKNFIKSLSDSMIIFEDFDLFLDNLGNEDGDKQKNKNKYNDRFLAFLLQLLDGSYSIENSIMIFTTNSKHKFGEALLRRMNKEYLIDYHNLDTFVKHFNFLYQSNFTIDGDQYTLKDNITGNILEKEYLSNDNNNLSNEDKLNLFNSKIIKK